MISPLNKSIEEFVKNHVDCSSVSIREIVQKLWSGYGSILRLELDIEQFPTIILKQVDVQGVRNHPRGWDTDRSHQRKLKSYEVEWHWYEKYAVSNHSGLKMPTYLGSQSTESHKFLLLEDLSSSGFPRVKSSITLDEVKLCLEWLAAFHATYLSRSTEGLWKTGTYWHLDTRPDEFERMESGKLKNHAHAIDRVLNECAFQTIVHGDAKLANFCFSQSGREVAGLDFQYVGGGCGMKDVAYFLSSCLSSGECFEYETELLNHYFEVLLKQIPESVNAGKLESEWRNLYAYAWADFIRFLEGWSPEHHKLHEYGYSQVDRVIG